MTDGESVGVEMELEWIARGPAFTMDTSKQSWTDAHYEQHCDVSGRIAWRGEELRAERDRAARPLLGPPDFSPIGRHCWIHAQWAGGHSFMIFHLITPGRLAHALPRDGGPGRGPRASALHERAPADLRPCRRAGGLPPGAGDRGRCAVVIDAEIEQASTLAMIGKSELGIGACHDASHWLSEAQTRFTWDGETAHGLTERTVNRGA